LDANANELTEKEK
jgi:hypothetical protein